MLLNDLEGMMKRFGGDKNFRAITSLDTSTPGSGVKSTVARVVGDIVVTSDSVFDPRENEESNGGLQFI